MSNVAHIAQTHQQPTEAQLLVGKVALADGATFVVALGARRCAMKRAHSCLVAPKVGDEVLVAWTDSGSAHVLAVLESSAAQAISVDGDLRIEARRLDLVGSEGLRLIGREINAHAARFVTVARTVEVTAERLRECFVDAFRSVEHTDSLRAGAIDQRAATSWQMRAKHALVSASELVKMDGDQIHLG